MMEDLATSFMKIYLKPLGPKQTNLNPFSEEDMLAFNNLVTRSCGAIDLTLSIEEGTHQRRKMTHIFRHTM